MTACRGWPVHCRLQAQQQHNPHEACALGCTPRHVTTRGSLAGLHIKPAHQVSHASHLSAPQGHHRQQAAAAALQDGAHSVEHPLLPAFPGQVIGHPIRSLHHHCSIAQHSSLACMWTHGLPLARLLKHGRQLPLHTPRLQATDVVIVRRSHCQTTQHTECGSAESIWGEE